MYDLLIEARQIIYCLQVYCDHRDTYCDASEFLTKLNAVIESMPLPSLYSLVKEYIETHEQTWYGPHEIAVSLGRDHSKVDNILRYMDSELGLQYDYTIRLWKKKIA